MAPRGPGAPLDGRGARHHATSHPDPPPTVSGYLYCRTFWGWRVTGRPFDHAFWRKIRVRVLDRDGWRCRIGLQGCTGEATEVDHIVPWRQGGAWFDDWNLRAACRSCNNARRTVRVARPSREW